MNKKIKFNLQTVISDLENIIKNQVQLETGILTYVCGKAGGIK